MSVLVHYGCQKNMGNNPSYRLQPRYPSGETRDWAAHLLCAQLNVIIYLTRYTNVFLGYFTNILEPRQIRLVSFAASWLQARLSGSVLAV